MLLNWLKLNVYKQTLHLSPTSPVPINGMTGESCSQTISSTILYILFYLLLYVLLYLLFDCVHEVSEYSYPAITSKEPPVVLVSSNIVTAAVNTAITAVIRLCLSPLLTLVSHAYHHTIIIVIITTSTTTWCPVLPY